MKFKKSIYKCYLNTWGSNPQLKMKKKELKERFPMIVDDKFIKSWELTLEFRMQTHLSINPMDIFTGRDYMFQCMLDTEKDRMINYIANSMKAGTLRYNIKVIEEKPIYEEYI